MWPWASYLTSVSLFLTCQIGVNNTYPPGLSWRLNAFIWVKHCVQCLVWNSVLWKWRLSYFPAFLVLYDPRASGWAMEQSALGSCLWANQSFPFSLSPPCLEPACQPQCSTCTSGLECSSCQPPLLVQHGQCVSTCGDGFYEDRHSCAGKHCRANSWVGHSLP